MTRLEPVHPGEVLKHDFMEPFAFVVQCAGQSDRRDAGED